MSSRNPLNERYTTDLKKGGKSRKSAASAKPKSAAAASVVKASKKKKPVSKAEQRAKKRDAKNKEFEAERAYGDPPTKKFKIMKRLWIASLVLAVIMVGLSFAASKIEGAPEWSGMFFLVAAYVFIIATLYIDLGQIRRMRKKYVAQMSSLQTKESRAMQKKKRAAQRKAEKEAEEKRIEDEKQREELRAKRADMTFVEKVKSFLNFKNK